MSGHHMEMESTILTPLCHVIIAGTGLLIPLALGMFNNVVAETQLDHYAEKPWPNLQSLMPLPANTLVNISYIIIGIYWLWKLQVQHKELGVHEKYLTNAFAWMAVVYGHIQAARLLSFNHKAAVLDQWVTLPIFSWVAVWSSHILHGWSPQRMLLITVVSSLSYTSSLIHPLHGFDCALMLHICFAVYYGLKALNKYQSHQAQVAFLCSLLCCSGFVGLKLLDHELPKIHPVFHMLSGHFWSKIADAFQFHFVTKFFLAVVHAKGKRH